MKWRYARKSRLEQAYSSVPKVKKQTKRKSLNSLEASPAAEAKHALSIADKMINIVV